MKCQNKIAKLIFLSGIIYLILIFLGGLTFGIVFQDSSLGLFYTSGMNWIIMMALWIMGFMTSLFFFWGAEIIELLHQQNYKMVKEESTVKREEPKVKREDYQHTKYDDLEWRK